MGFMDDSKKKARDMKDNAQDKMEDMTDKEQDDTTMGDKAQSDTMRRRENTEMDEGM